MIDLDDIEQRDPYWFLQGTEHHPDVPRTRAAKADEDAIESKAMADARGVLREQIRARYERSKGIRTGRIGRPRKLTEAVLRKILHAAYCGAKTHKVLAAAAGVHRTTFAQWLSDFPVLSDMIEEEQGATILELLELQRAEAMVDGRERRYLLDQLDAYERGEATTTNEREPASRVTFGDPTPRGRAAPSLIRRKAT